MNISIMVSFVLLNHLSSVHWLYIGIMAHESVNLVSSFQIQAIQVRSPWNWVWTSTLHASVKVTPSDNK